MSALNSESVELLEPKQHFLKRPPVDIEFTDLTYSVSLGRTGSKLILRSVSGLFKSGQLTAILGPSGAGKSTLLNVLAGYKCGAASGSISVNGEPRVMRKFHKMSRYIMQEDLLQPRLTVAESMSIASDLKLGQNVPRADKIKIINEILELLRLAKCKKTLTTCLSGGEKKRLSIALELVNNPPVIFLDEPTTGLDDLSSSQCISLLKNLAHGGRTIICSIHTPSARLFAEFDHVYIVSEGQCVFQGHGHDIVPFLASLGLHCPKHYNPADFMVEVASGEYGDHTERMMMAIDNGRCYRWNQTLRPLESPGTNEKISHENLHEIKHLYNFESSQWFQFRILMYRMLLRNWRDCGFIMLKAIMYVFTGFVNGFLFFQMGKDGSKTIFNFGFCFVSLITLMYIPMLPALLQFPEEVKLLKREHFNRWYGLNPYFLALTLMRLPLQASLSCIYIVLAYTLSDQPMEWERGIKFALVCVLVAIVSESFGLTIGSYLNIVNGIFLGPACSVPFMLLAVYGIGSGSHLIPLWVRLAMHLSYIRYGLKGLVAAIYVDRSPLICPDTEIYCNLREPKSLLKEVGMEDVVYWVDVASILFYFFLFKTISYFLLRQRLSSTISAGTLSYIGRIVKSHFSLSRTV